MPYLSTPTCVPHTLNQPSVHCICCKRSISLLLKKKVLLDFSKAFDKVLHSASEIGPLWNKKHNRLLDWRLSLVTYTTGCPWGLFLSYLTYHLWHPSRQRPWTSSLPSLHQWPTLQSPINCSFLRWWLPSVCVRVY